MISSAQAVTIDLMNAEKRPSPPHLGRRLMLVRERRGYRTMEEWATSAGVSRGTLGHIKSGRNADVKLDTLRSLARSANVSLAWLATGRGAWEPYEGEDVRVEPEAPALAPVVPLTPSVPTSTDPRLRLRDRVVIASEKRKSVDDADRAVLASYTVEDLKPGEGETVEWWQDLLVRIVKQRLRLDRELEKATFETPPPGVPASTAEPATGKHVVVESGDGPRKPRRANEDRDPSTGDDAPRLLALAIVVRRGLREDGRMRQGGAHVFRAQRRRLPPVRAVPQRGRVRDEGQDVRARRVATGVRGATMSAGEIEMRIGFVEAPGATAMVSVVVSAPGTAEVRVFAIDSECRRSGVLLKLDAAGLDELDALLARARELMRKARDAA